MWENSLILKEKSINRFRPSIFANNENKKNEP